VAQIDDLNAIEHYMQTANAQTPAALVKQLEFKAWYAQVSWLDKTMDDDVYAKARRYRDDFNTANKGVTAPGQTATPQQKLTIKAGSTGPNVVEWQKIIGVAADGKFGPNTTAKTVEWQRKNGLTADGIVGPATWTKALQPNIFVAVSNTVTTAQKEAKATSPVAKTVVPAASLPVAQSAVKSSGSNVLKQGSSGPQVAKWQGIIGIKQSGTFDAITKTATQKWQLSHGLTPDGIVGDKTWAAAAVVLATAPSVSSVTESVKNAASQVAAVAINAITAAPQQVVNAVQSIPLWLQITSAVLGLGTLWALIRKPKA